MTLPDTFERAGVVVGSALMVALPMVAVLAVLVPDAAALPLWQVALAQLGPGVAVGLLVAAGWLPVTYRGVWLWSLLVAFGAYAAWWAVGVDVPSQQPAVSLAWLVAVALLAAVVTASRGRLRTAVGA